MILALLLRIGIPQRFAAVLAYVLPALAIAAVLWWHFHGDAKTKAERDRLRDDVVQWQKANATNLASVKLLTDTLNDQSARVRALATASERQQQAAQAALGRATARRDASEAVALRIERGARPTGCQTAPEVLQAKDEL